MHAQLAPPCRLIKRQFGLVKARWGVGQRVVRGYATLAGIASFGPVIEARPAAALLFGRQSQ